MSLPFDQGTRSGRPRAVSNGGLGGFVHLEQLARDQNYGSKSPWPKRKKQRPSPIDVGIEGSLMLTAWSTTSAVMQEYRTPVTPGTVWTANTTHPAAAGMTPDRASPPVSRYNWSGRARVYPSMPGTPSTPDPKLNSQPVELPGSLLLPSQGFPQSEPPVTPSRQTFQRDDSDESISTLSSTPGLSACSSVTATDMDVLRSFSPKKKAPKSITSLPGATTIHKIGKPFSAMTAEELIQCLPECSPALIANTWVPAMLREYQKIKKLLQQAAEIKMEANAQLGDFGNEIDSISKDARKISTTYEHALLRAESLYERDLKSVQEKLGNAEQDLGEALVAIDGQRDIIGEKEEVIKALQQNMDAIVRVLGAFIEDTLPQSVHSLETERVHEVMQLLADYSPSAGAGGPRSPLQLSSPFLRVPEATFHAHLQNLRDSQTKIESYRKLAHGQNNLIRSQSADLDQRVVDYQRCVKTIKERDHEILLLVERNDAQRKIIEEFEAERKVSEGVKMEEEKWARERQNMEWAIDTLKRDHAKQIDDQDAEIQNLRQKLASAWEAGLAGKADVEKGVGQTQALLAPPELREGGTNSASNKERKMLTKNKTNDPLASSRSMLSLNMSQATLGWGKSHVAAAPFSAVEPAPYKNHPKLQMEARSPRVDDVGWGCGIPRKRRSVPNLRRAAGAVEDVRLRARNDSLDAVSSERDINDLELLRTLVRGSVDDSSTITSINTDKALPIPPDVQSEDASIHSSDGGHSVTGEVLQDMLSPDAPTQNFHTPLSPRNRVLSGIPEMSAEDAESERSSPSATSSDREAYRKSIDALNMIEMMGESDLRMGADVPDYDGSDYGPVEVGIANSVRVARGLGAPMRIQYDTTSSLARSSPIKTASQMHHAASNIMRK